MGILVVYNNNCAQKADLVNLFIAESAFSASKGIFERVRKKGLFSCLGFHFRNK